MGLFGRRLSPEEKIKQNVAVQRAEGEQTPATPEQEAPTRDPRENTPPAAEQKRVEEVFYYTVESENRSRLEAAANLLQFQKDGFDPERDAQIQELYEKTQQLLQKTEKNGDAIDGIQIQNLLDQMKDFGVNIDAIG